MAAEESHAVSVRHEYPAHHPCPEHQGRVSTVDADSRRRRVAGLWPGWQGRGSAGRASQNRGMDEVAVVRRVGKTRLKSRVPVYLRDAAVVTGLPNIER